MPRLTILLFALVAVLGVGLAWVAFRPLPQPITEAQVRAIVSEAMAAGNAAVPPAGTTLDAATLNPMIEDYLVSNPRILQQVANALETELRAAEAARVEAAVSSLQTEIYEDSGNVVLGNPDGDVTLVEMFDYNCHFCRQALPDLATLIAEDPNLKVILREFPILSQDSIDAARVAVLVSEADVDYWAFHQALFTSRGIVNLKTALDAAAGLGLNPIELQLEASTPRVRAVLDRTYAIAGQLNISGTPAYILGNEIINGAVGVDELRRRIASMRECGRTDCALPATAAATAAPASTNG